MDNFVRFEGQKTTTFYYAAMVNTEIACLFKIDAPEDSSLVVQILLKKTGDHVPVGHTKDCKKLTKAEYTSYLEFGFPEAEAVHGIYVAQSLRDPNSQPSPSIFVSVVVP